MKSRNAGEKNPMWNGGITISSGGYRMIRVPGHRRATKKGHYVFEHIIVMEAVIGRVLDPVEIVHHKNGNKLDNRPVNLELMTAKEHRRHHPPAYKYPKGVPHTAEHNLKVSEAKKKWWKERKKNAQV